MTEELWRIDKIAKRWLRAMIVGSTIAALW